MSTITIGGNPVVLHSAVNASYTYADVFMMQNPSGGFPVPFDAGTAVAGSVVLSGSGMFDPVTNNSIQLVSGLNASTNDWYRLEANAVPIPGAVWLLGSGLIGIIGIRRKLKK